jgi:hypothetical protein
MKTSSYKLIYDSIFYGAETWTLWKIDKYLESFEMWRRRMERISWTDRVINEEVLQRVKEVRNILHTINFLAPEFDI